MGTPYRTKVLSYPRCREPANCLLEHRMSAHHDFLDPDFLAARKEFVLLWGEMASSWGINRTMAQLHALLYLSEEPMDTEQVMQELDISRGNANTNLRQLLQWDLVEKVALPGERKDFFTAEKDVWQITAHIIKHRHKREIEPVKQQLSETRILLKDRPIVQRNPDSEEAKLLQRIDNLLNLMTVFSNFTNVLLPMVEQRDSSTIKTLVAIVKAMRQGE